MEKNKTVAVATTITAAVVGVGLLAACGSGTASEQASQSPSASQSRDAGLLSKEVNVKLVNNSGQAIDARKVYTITDENSAVWIFPDGPASTLNNGAELDLVSDDDSGFSIKNTKANKTDALTVYNSSVKKPRLSYTNNAHVNTNLKDKNSTEGWKTRSFDENESLTWKSPTTGYTYKITRGKDTTTKMFTIIVLP